MNTNSYSYYWRCRRSWEPGARSKETVSGGGVKGGGVKGGGVKGGGVRHLWHGQSCKLLKKEGSWPGDFWVAWIRSPDCADSVGLIATTHVQG